MRSVFSGLLLLAAFLVTGPAFPVDGQSGVAALQEDYDGLEQSYRRSLYQAQQPVLKAHLKTLEAWKQRVTSKGHTDLADEIDREIDALKAQIAEETKALEGELKEVPELLVRSPEPPAAQPRTVAADFHQATLEGGTTVDAETGNLRGWQAGRAQAVIPVNTLPGITYAIELEYASVEKGHLKVSAGTSRFMAELKETGGFDKKETLRLGKHRSQDSQTLITISMPIHRSKEFVHLKALRLVPVDG